jgi:hypothetical protein
MGFVGKMTWGHAANISTNLRIPFPETGHRLTGVRRDSIGARYGKPDVSDGVTQRRCAGFSPILSLVRKCLPRKTREVKGSTSSSLSCADVAPVSVRSAVRAPPVLKSVSLDASTRIRSVSGARASCGADDHCNRSAMLRSSRSHLRSIRTASRSGTHRAAAH